MSLLMSAAARGNAAIGADNDLLGGYQKPDWLRKMATPSIQHVKGLPRKSSPINSAAVLMEALLTVVDQIAHGTTVWELGIKP